MKMHWYDRLTNNNGPRFWWTAKSEDELARSVVKTLENLLSVQGHHHARNKHHGRLYHNGPMNGFSMPSYDDDDYLDRLTYNVIESAIDTIHADITGNRPKPMFLTTKGNFEQQERAKGLNKYVEGQFYDAKIHVTEAPMAALDAMIYGTGFIKVFRKDDRPAAERVFPDQLVVDDTEALNGKPRTLFEHRSIAREVLAAAYPKSKKKLRDTPAHSGEIDVNHQDRLADHVHVVEAWHLPSGEGAGDGRHVICVENAVLCDEKWTRDSFPFAKLQYKPRSRGWFGKGVAEILDGNQLAINELLWKIHQSLRLAGPKVFVEPGSQLNTAHLDNEIWSIIECIGVPKHVVFESVPPDLFRQLRQEIEDAYSQVGVNMLSARSEIPAGLDGGSGKAIRMYADQKSKRLIKFAQAYEEMHLEIARQFVEVTRDIEESGIKPKSVLAAKRRAAQKIEWSKVNLQRDSYIMQLFPTSYLSSTPAGKLKDIEDLLQVFPQLQEHAPKLMDFPDLEGVMSIVTSSADLVREMLDSILHDGRFVSPEPHMDLQATLKLAQGYYLRAKIDGASEKRLKQVNEFIKSCRRLIKKAQEPDPAAQPQVSQTPQPGMPAQPALPPAQGAM